MTEQTSLFASPEESAYALIEPKLNTILVEKNHLGAEHLRLIERKLFYSLQFDSTVILRIYGGSNPKIAIAQRHANNADFAEHELLELARIKDYESQIAVALQYAIDQVPTEYSCCSRYEECSNAKGCTEPNDDIAIKCSYRKKLQKGIIFFGKNRNVE